MEAQVGLNHAALPLQRSTATTCETPSDFGRLLEHRRVWKRKPILRRIYENYFRTLETELSDVSGPTIEIGGGPGCFKTYRPDVISFDLIACPWLDFAADACALPFASASVANVAMIDVLHHLPYISRFFHEMTRVLRPGGRLIMIEPYISPLSWWVYRFIHPEPLDLTARPLDASAADPACDPDSPWDGNQAIPTLVFWRKLNEFRSMFPHLEVIQRRRLSMLAYPLSGGFGHHPPCPSRWVETIDRLERRVPWPTSLAAFRCLTVIERAT